MLVQNVTLVSPVEEVLNKEVVGLSLSKPAHEVTLIASDPRGSRTTPIGMTDLFPTDSSVVENSRHRLGNVARDLMTTRLHHEMRGLVSASTLSMLGCL